MSSFGYNNTSQTAEGFSIMMQNVGLIGFGEAGSTFAIAGNWGAAVRAFDIKTQDAQALGEMQATYARAGVVAAATLDDAVRGPTLLLSMVTADQALTVAKSAARSIGAGALYCDLNSVAPQTKQAAAKAIEAGGARYIDVAIMAPVKPASLGVPLLLSGADAAEAKERLEALGFNRARIVGAEVGRASAIKMIRSVMVKGLEALTAECVLAAEAAGVREEVIASLDASDNTMPWAERTDYNFGRMMIHGLRRAAEMEEVVKTLDGFGTGATMTRATVIRQREIGALGHRNPASDIRGKIAQITGG